MRMYLHGTVRQQVSESTVEALRREIAEKQKALKTLARAEKIKAMRQDVRTLDFIDKVTEAFNDGDIDTARKVASYLYKALNYDSVNPVTFDYDTQFQRYLSTNIAIKMPKEWGFRGKNEIELERGLTYSIGARPGTGKSTLMCNMAYHWAYTKAYLDYKVGMMTNEMKDGQLWVKMFQIHLNLTKQLRRPFMLAKDWLRYPKKFPDEYRQMREFAATISKNLVIANVRKMPGEEVNMVIDDMKNTFGRYPDITFLDYLQRVAHDKSAKDERLGIVSTVQGFSEKMMDIDGIMFIFSQMNKEGGFKGSEAPQEEAGIAWEIMRDKDREGKFLPFIDWRIAKTRITAYVKNTTRYDDMSGTLLPNDEAPEPFP